VGVGTYVRKCSPVSCRPILTIRKNSGGYSGSAVVVATVIPLWQRYSDSVIVHLFTKIYAL